MFFFLRDGLRPAVSSNWGLTPDYRAKPDMLIPVFPRVKRQTVRMNREIGYKLLGAARIIVL